MCVHVSVCVVIEKIFKKLNIRDRFIFRETQHNA